MNLVIQRQVFTPKSTIGTLSVDGQVFCNTLEDVFRGMGHPKVFGQTAIPAGAYEVIINRSNVFSDRAGHSVYLPLLQHVPGYEGVRIHVGNYPKDTLGCILVGRYSASTPDFVAHSRDTFNQLFPLMQHALQQGQRVLLTIS